MSVTYLLSYLELNQSHFALSTLYPNLYFSHLCMNPILHIPWAMEAQTSSPSSQPNVKVNVEPEISEYTLIYTKLMKGA